MLGGAGLFGVHGYLVQVAVRPDLIVPSQWLGPLLSLDDGEGFDGLDEANEILGAIMALYNHVNGQVLDGGLTLLEGCELRDDPMANFGLDAPIGRWAAGFAFAEDMLGPLGDAVVADIASGIGRDTVMVIAESLQSLSFHLAVFADYDTVVEGFRNDPGLKSDPEIRVQHLAELVHEQLHDHLVDLAQIAQALRGHTDAEQADFSDPPLAPLYPAAPRQPVRSEKIGRNDPCPCGSGRKYKKCCGDPRR